MTSYDCSRTTSWNPAQLALIGQQSQPKCQELSKHWKPKSLPLPRKDALFRSEIWNTSAEKAALPLLAQHRACRYRARQQLRSIYSISSISICYFTCGTYHIYHTPETTSKYSFTTTYEELLSVAQHWTSIIRNTIDIFHPHSIFQLCRTA